MPLKIIKKNLRLGSTIAFENIVVSWYQIVVSCPKLRRFMGKEKPIRLTFLTLNVI